MIDAQWIEVVGRRDPGLPPAPPRKAASATGRRASVGREASVALLILTLGIGLHLAAPLLRSPAPRRTTQQDVFAAAQLGEIRSALELYRREKGLYPAKLTTLVDDDWIETPQTRIIGFDVRYRVDQGGQSYRLELDPKP